MKYNRERRLSSKIQKEIHIMRQVKVGEQMSAILESLDERAEIVDIDGTLLGYFDPAELVYRKAATLLDPEEIRTCQLADGRWHFTDEMIDRLLAPNKCE